MGIEIEDVKLGTDEELTDAIRVVGSEIGKADFSNPTLFLQLPTIREFLMELKRFREVIKKLKEKRT